ncbi:MAG: anaerobic ribonucleoside-triphosphate reductase activating protein [Bdellovibrionales bacterium]|jgi:pyruvate formate lyase activating enzyme
MSSIYEISPFTLLDYPDELACIVWMSGCNLRCVYCHNPDIVLKRGTKEPAELYSFLESRKGKLTAVVFSGGEATFCPTLPELMRKTKEMGFKVKLDTNGGNPDMLKKLLGEGLLDYVALDYKCPPKLAKKILGTSKFEKAFRKSLDFLIKQHNAGRLVLEIRTTVAPEIMSEADIGWIIDDLDKLGYEGTYWIQHIVSSGDKTLGNIAKPEGTIDPDLIPTPKNFLLGFRNFPGA